MTPEMRILVGFLRDWHAQATTDDDPDQYPALLGAGTAIVGMLLEQLDREGATDGPAE